MMEYTWEPLTEMPSVGDRVKHIISDDHHPDITPEITIYEVAKLSVTGFQIIDDKEEAHWFCISNLDRWLIRKPAKQTKPDNVNSPSHYTAGKIETIDYIQDKLTPEQFEGYCIGNAHKYISRYKLKNGKEDLEKAAWYLNRAIEGYEE